jgi:hypothetical protein
VFHGVSIDRAQTLKQKVWGDVRFTTRLEKHEFLPIFGGELAYGLLVFGPWGRLGLDLRLNFTNQHKLVFNHEQTARPVNKVRDLRNVASHALYSLLCLVLNREASENTRRTVKAVSSTGARLLHAHLWFDRRGYHCLDMT